MSFSAARYDDEAQKDKRVLKSIVGKFKLFCVCSIIFVCVFKVYLGPFARNYERRVDLRDKGTAYLEWGGCKPELRVRLENYNLCERSIRDKEQNVYLGAFFDTIDEINPFEWVLGSNSGFLSPHVIFRLAAISFALLALLWMASVLGMFVDGHKAVQARYMLPLYDRQAAKEKAL